MKIIVLGSTGMLGHTVEAYLKEKGYNVIGTARNDFDATKDDFEDLAKKHNPDVVVNCIGILNKDAEENKSKAVLINSYLPHYIDELSKKYNYKFIHISTDCVFEGTKGSYKEDDFKDATSFYGRTKALGETGITLRTSIIGHDINDDGIGLFNWYMKQEDKVEGYSKVYWTGVTTLELAKIIEVVMHSNMKGIYHAVNDTKISKYKLLKLFSKYFKKLEIIKNDEVVSDKSLIKSRDYYPYKILDYEDMIKEMKDWSERK